MASRSGPTAPPEALARGLMLLSGERVRESLFPVLGVRANATVGILKRFARLGFVNRRDETHAAANVVRQLNVRTPSIEQPVRFLSGGNQQKVVLARPILGDVDVLLAEEPTQGVDIRSRFEIYEALRSRSSEGMSVLVRSADAIELAGICDRVVIVSRGQVVREVSGADLTEDRIVEAIIRTQSVTPRPPARGRRLQHLRRRRRTTSTLGASVATPGRATGEPAAPRRHSTARGCPSRHSPFFHSSSRRTRGSGPTPSSPSST